MSETSELLRDIIKAGNKAAAFETLCDALETALNIEGAAMLGAREGAYTGLDVPWHFDKIRRALAVARAMGWRGT